MALFSLKEKRAGLLTQFYQVEVTPEQLGNPALLEGSELDAWLYWQLWGDLVKGRPDPPAPLLGRDSWVASTRSESGEEAPLPMIRDLALLHGVLRRVMDAVADGRDLSRPEDEGDLNRFIQETLASPWVLFNPGAAPRIIHGRDPNSWYVPFALLEELVRALSDRALVRCMACKSVFPQWRRGTKYCSDRCSSRAQSQRFYARHKEKEQEAIAA